MKYIAILLTLASCSFKPTIDPYISPDVERDMPTTVTVDTLWEVGGGTDRVGIAVPGYVDPRNAVALIARYPADSASTTLPIEPHRLDMAPPTANAGPDDTVYFPQRGFALKGRCTNAATRTWTVLRTSLPSGGKDTMTVNLYGYFIDYRFTCKASNGQTAYDDKRVWIMYNPHGALTVFDAGIFGKWVIDNTGTPRVMLEVK